MREIQISWVSPFLNFFCALVLIRIDFKTYCLALVNNAVTFDMVKPRLVIPVNFSTLIANEFLFLLIIAFFQGSFLMLGQMSLQILFIIKWSWTFRALVHPVFFLFFGNVGTLQMSQKFLMIRTKVFGAFVANQFGLMNLQSMDTL